MQASDWEYYHCYITPCCSNEGENTTCRDYATAEKCTTLKGLGLCTHEYPRVLTDCLASCGLCAGMHNCIDVKL